MSKAVRTIEDSVGERFTVDDFARQAGLSVSYFKHLFRKEIGVTPKRVRLLYDDDQVTADQ